MIAHRNDIFQLTTPQRPKAQAPDDFRHHSGCDALVHTFATNVKN
jgi:hypothetical protein